MEREKLKSRLGFILLSAGCAIGIGNVWKFPYIAGQGGRRRVRAVLPDLPHHSGPAHHDHGVCSGPRFPQKPGAGKSGTGKAGPEVAHPRLPHPHRAAICS